MSLLSKLFKDKVAGATSSVDKAISKDVVEATIAGSILIASASDGISDEEIAALETVLSMADDFKPWKADFNTLIVKFSDMVTKSPRLGRMKVMQEIADIASKNPKDKDLVMNCILEVADASGDIETAEKEVLKEIASTIGVDLRKYSL